VEKRKKQIEYSKRVRQRHALHVLFHGSRGSEGGEEKKKKKNMINKTSSSMSPIGLETTAAVTTTPTAMTTLTKSESCNNTTALISSPTDAATFNSRPSQNQKLMRDDLQAKINEHYLQQQKMTSQKLNKVKKKIKKIK